MSAVVYAVANQKGGVAKTTTTASLATAWANMGLRVLAVDLDPQAALTFSLGFDPDSLYPTIHDALTTDVALASTIIRREGLDLVPANLDLSGIEAALVRHKQREGVLRRSLDLLRTAYDIIIIDCPPSLGTLTLNALTAADQLVIPVQCETLSHRGVSQLLGVAEDVQQLTNPELFVAGVVATMFDGRTRHSRDVLNDVLNRYEINLLGVPVRKSVRFAEAPNLGISIHQHAYKTPGAAAYRVIAAELHKAAPDAEDVELAGRYAQTDE